MFSQNIHNKKSTKIVLIFLLIFTITIQLFNCKISSADSGTETEDNIKNYVTNIFMMKCKAIISQDMDSINNLYDTDNQLGQWAYEYELKRIKYLNNWAEKQGVLFKDIMPNIVIQKSNIGKDKCSFYVLCNTEYKYSYGDEPDVINSSRIGTYHSIKLIKKNDRWIISKEWYTDPFADSLSLDNIKVDKIRNFINTQKIRDISSLNERRINCIDYAMKYCGAATVPENNYKYNKDYRNFNPEGGDCANFASQILHEGGKFKKTSAWQYSKGSATGPWINADKFTQYMLYSGRASIISKGNYEQVFKASYKLLPGDFVAYEKKGDITHISVVTGSDSKGYSLVTCHNTDRNNVPWDLGWSNKEIKFWLVRVHL